MSKNGTYIGPFGALCIGVMGKTWKRNLYLGSVEHSVQKRMEIEPATRRLLRERERARQREKYVYIYIHICKGLGFACWWFVLKDGYRKDKRKKK